MMKTPPKVNHRIRKTCISNMEAPKALTNEEIRKFASHKDFSTTRNEETPLTKGFLISLSNAEDGT